MYAAAAVSVCHNSKSVQTRAPHAVKSVSRPRAPRRRAAVAAVACALAALARSSAIPVAQPSLPFSSVRPLPDRGEKVYRSICGSGGGGDLRRTALLILLLQDSPVKSATELGRVRERTRAASGGTASCSPRGAKSTRGNPGMRRRRLTQKKLRKWALHCSFEGENEECRIEEQTSARTKGNFHLSAVGRNCNTAK